MCVLSGVAGGGQRRISFASVVEMARQQRLAESTAAGAPGANGGGDAVINIGPPAVFHKVSPAPLVATFEEPLSTCNSPVTATGRVDGSVGHFCR